MNILVINGSPRVNGNTRAALDIIVNSIARNKKNVTTEVYDVSRHKLSSCINCDACKNNNNTCVSNDESAQIIEKIYESDFIIFGSPVYWWGITAQLKMVVDKMYSKAEKFRKQIKRIGIITDGKNALDDPQYNLINEQYKLICKFLGWDIVFSYSICTDKENEIFNNKKVLKQLNKLWEKL